MNDLQSKQKYHNWYGYLTFSRHDVIFIHKNTKERSDFGRLNVRPIHLYVDYFEDRGMHHSPAIQHVDFDDHNYPKAENFITELNFMITDSVLNILVEEMAYSSVLYSGEEKFKYLKISLKKEKCSIIKLNTQSKMNSIFSSC